MDFIVVFFRDILDGPLYISIVIINSILICSCIGYLADNYLKRKKAIEDYNNTYATVGNNVGVSIGATAAQSVQQGVQFQQTQNTSAVPSTATSVVQPPTQSK